MYGKSRQRLYASTFGVIYTKTSTKFIGALPTVFTEELIKVGWLIKPKHEAYLFDRNRAISQQTLSLKDTSMVYIDLGTQSYGCTYDL